MTSEVVISAAAVKAAPNDYTIRPSQQVVLLCVTASLDGTGSAGSYEAEVQLISDAGLVMARCPCLTPVAVGGSADVSWFPLSKTATSTSPTTPYEALILNTPGIRAYWKLDETTGTTAFDSANAHYNLTYRNGVTLGQPPLADVFSASLAAASQQRIGDRVAPPGQPDIQGNGQMSIEFWVKTSAAVATYIIASDSSSADGRFFYVHMAATGIPEYAIFDTAANGYSLFGSIAINDGAKHYCVGTFDGTTMRWYVDGVLDTSTVPAMGGNTLADHNQGVVLGAGFPGFPNYQQWLTGTLDEVSLYDLAISQANITAHFNAA